jgi:hypothetical protein
MVIVLLVGAMATWPELFDAVFKAIREQGLATVEVVFGFWVLVVVLRNARDAVQSVWNYFKPLGEEVAQSISQWFRAMTDGQLAHTSALAELTNTIQRMDKGKLIEDIHAITSRSHDKLNELAARPFACKGAAGEPTPKN